MGLWLKAVVDVDDEDRDIGEGTAAGTKRRKRVVAGRVDKEQAGKVEVGRVSASSPVSVVSDSDIEKPLRSL